MGDVLIVIIIFILLAPVLYFLWINGYMSLNVKRAMLYIGKRGKNYRGATVDSCSGYVKTVFKVKESRNYQFALDLTQEKGNIFVEIHGSNKECAEIFDYNNKEKTIFLDCNKRYYLKFNYKQATGNVKLSWKP